MENPDGLITQKATENVSKNYFSLKALGSKANSLKTSRNR